MFDQSPPTVTGKHNVTASFRLWYFFVATQIAVDSNPQSFQKVGSVP